MDTKKNIIVTVAWLALAAAAISTAALAGKVPGATMDLSTISSV